MSDFDEALRGQLERNERLAQEREAAEREMDLALERAQEAEQRAQQDRRAAQHERHTELADRLSTLVEKVRGAAAHVDVRAYWSASREEYVARFATPTIRPRRTLHVELDRDDDQVLARWNSDLGQSLELYRLLEFDETMLDALVLQVIDDDLWRGRDRNPTFPGNQD